MSALLLLSASLAWTASGYDPAKLPYGVRYKGLVNEYRVGAIFLSPGEETGIEVLDPHRVAYSFAAPAGLVSELGRHHWRWRAPEAPGLYPLRVAGPGGAMTINAFVLVPASRARKGQLNGYRIGRYPAAPPAGFIEVRPDSADTALTPHLTLRQFLCKQEGGWPKYLALDEELLITLEQVLEEVNASGHRAAAFSVLSGYRTPYYNQKIKNVPLSRHLWGQAADIFVDESPKDGMMDDLNRDGRVDSRDADVLYAIIDRMADKPWYRRFTGGLARYVRSLSHGPFVHVDVRGRRARW